VVIYWNTPELWGEVLPRRAATAAAVMALAQAGYCSLFGVVGLLTRRALIAGLAYIVAFEGLLANFDAVVRRLTVTYYFRVLSLDWLVPSRNKAWSLDPLTIPSTANCLLTLLTASVLFVLLGVALMRRREFRMKTAEGS
jgi:ABC-2 type transport system permease protein